MNTGPREACRLLQRIVDAPADGVLGPKSLAAINNYIAAEGLPKLIDAYTEARQAYYRMLPTYVHFGDGWRKRADEVAVLAKGLSEQQAG